ncbi:MAG: 2-amino-4-hydroxy-6-hydroxymethyldihydropteridine diphosphokinase [Rhodospirillales bacterium]|nr:2-amino-4-hydroxy-6-hydroxymethyldihydropteridine diphosphokinase [Rhodospirillales bacterium]
MILIALGANLVDAAGRAPLLALPAAAAALDGLLGLRLSAVSALYRSPAWPEVADPAARQPDYVNAVARLDGAADPGALLAALLAMEAAAGRRRGQANAARPLDLDIIAMGKRGAMLRAAPDPILPHPRAHLRRFVLAPLLDVAPGFVHPVLHRSARQLMAALPPTRIEKITMG